MIPESPGSLAALRSFLWCPPFGATSSASWVHKYRHKRCYSFLLILLFLIYFQTVVLSSSSSNKKTSTDGSIPSHCGANFCYPPYHSDQVDIVGWNFNTSSPSVDFYKSADAINNDHLPENIPFLLMILMGISFLATLILIFFVDTIPDTPKFCDKVSTSHNIISSRKMLMATFRQLKNPNQILLIPMILWTGFEHAFWAADFTYVSLPRFINICRI